MRARFLTAIIFSQKQESPVMPPLMPLFASDKQQRANVFLPVPILLFIIIIHSQIDPLCGTPAMDLYGPILSQLLPITLSVRL